MENGWVWILVASVAAVALLLATFFIIRKKRSLPKHANTVDNIIGEKCVVIEKIDNFAGCGEARVNGLVWSARAAFEDDVYEVGEVLVIVAVEGVKLICKKQI